MRIDRLHLLLLCSIVFSVCHTQAQTAIDETKSEVNWILKAGAGLNSSFRKSLLTNENAASKAEYDKRNLFEVPGKGFSVDLMLSRSITKKIYFDVGLCFERYQYKSGKIPLSFGDPIDPRIGFIYMPEKTGTQEYMVNYLYSKIPLGMSCQLGLGALTFSCAAHVSPAFLTAYSSKTFVDSSHVVSSEYNHEISNQLHRFNLFTSLSAGIQYQFLSDLAFGLQTEFSFGHLKTSSFDITERLYGYGLKAYIGYTLNAVSTADGQVLY
ncbi:MAG: hypothetical protein K1X54_04720 [Flavobacteriales bacterium]|nr:hypothetical protein [Flavobacteriales bacterium]